jgi:hypothetical protein
MQINGIMTCRIGSYMHIGNYQKQNAAVILLMIMIIVSGCNGNKEIKRQTEVSAAYSDSIKKAITSNEPDQLANVFRVIDEIKISGKDIGTLIRLKTTDSGKILILYESFMKQSVIAAYSHKGEWINNIGKPGVKPGEFRYATDIVSTEGKRVFVTDYKTSRISTFAENGQFESSFIIPQKYSASKIVEDSDNGVLYVGGHKRIANGMLAVHKYGKNGAYLGSFVPLSDQAVKRGYTIMADIFMDSVDGWTYVAFPFEYKVYRLAPNGNVSTIIESNEKPFKLPDKDIPVLDKDNLIRSERIMNEWYANWTPIVGIYAIANRKMVVQYRVCDPLLYRIDIWSIPENRRIGSVHTNHLLMAKDKEGSLYCLENIERKAQTEYVIKKMELQKKWLDKMD